ncbi:MAG: septum formation initiator family protein [Corynebacterium sp.]|nr:septum formation initiator family protein [Corynebacterium sp.]
MSKNSVPVRNREIRGSKKPKPRPRGLPRVTVARAVVGFLVLILAALTIAMPLRNYFQQRTEVARVEASIVAKQAEKAALLAEIDKYSDQAYLDEATRNRLGVIAPGQTAYRLMDPGIVTQDSTDSSRVEYHPEFPWYKTLWNSVARPVVSTEETTTVEPLPNGVAANATPEPEAPAVDEPTQ